MGFTLFVLRLQEVLRFTCLGASENIFIVKQRQSHGLINAHSLRLLVSLCADV